MEEKIVGYLLIGSGLIVMVLASLSVYSVFTKKSAPVQLFNFGPISLDASQLIPQDLPEGAGEIINKQSSGLPKAELLPANVLNDSSNVFAHHFLMGFIVSVGYKIASLGAVLVRPVNVKLRAKEEKPQA